MHFTRFWSIVEAHHDIQNPSSPTKLDHLIDLAELHAHHHVLDIGSGRGWLLNRIATRTGAQGTGIEINPWFCQTAQQHAHAAGNAERITIIESDATTVTFAPHSFDAVFCIGATFALGGLINTINFARNVAKKDAPIIIGDIFRYATELPPTLVDYGFVPSLAELVDIVRGNNEPHEMMVSTLEEWDHYETKKWQSARTWLINNPDDPDHTNLSVAVAKMRHDYLHRERDAIGWAMIMTYNSADA
ncbi:MAG: SAM-dependent methyltransferase [Roseiflexaceae bacterium]|jgi:cyclopropane fatty-acyl-phospholipid synthase-like methyltransferase